MQGYNDLTVDVSMRSENHEELVARRVRDSSHAPRSSGGCFSSFVLLVLAAAVLFLIHLSGVFGIGR
jgi:hypothetical protein